MPITRRTFFAALAGVPLLGRLVSAAPSSPIVAVFEDYDSWAQLRFAEIGTRFIVEANGRRSPAMITRTWHDFDKGSVEIEWHATDGGPVWGLQTISLL